MRPAPLCLLLLLAAAVTTAQTNLADVLGYAPGTRLLIIHADDLGMSHSVNEASFEAMTKGAVNSASVMMPTPWVPEAVAFAKTYPELDLGLHLTLTSEWTNYRWGPTGRDSVAGLLDADHYLHGECRPMAAKATVAEVERELRAQVEQALRLGLRPTHLDSHMGCVFYTNPGFFGAYLRVARDYDLPALIDGGELRGGPPEFRAYLQPDDLVVDRVIGASVERQGDFKRLYDALLRDLEPGVSVLLLHCGFDNAELRAAVAPQVPFGAAWRQEDLDYFTSPDLKALLDREAITLVTWRELHAKWKAR